MMHIVKGYWRHLLVLASLAWIVFAYGQGAFDDLDDIFTFSLVFGPLLISTAAIFTMTWRPEYFRLNWRPILVLATVVWGVVGYSPILDEYGRDDGYPFIFGPFVIAMAVYFLFPKRKDR